MSISKIYLSGAHSTGKTTLLNDLKPHLNVHVEEEIARSVIRTYGWTRTDFLPDTNPDNFLKLNKDILKLQIENERKCLDTLKDFIADRCIDPLVYAEHYLGPVEKQKLWSTQGIGDWIQRLKSALIFVIKPHKECIKDDSVRLPPKLSELQLFHDKILREYQDLDIPVYEVIDLDQQKRKNFVLSKINEIYPNLLIINGLKTCQ